MDDFDAGSWLDAGGGFDDSAFGGGGDSGGGGGLFGEGSGFGGFFGGGGGGGGGGGDDWLSGLGSFFGSVAGGILGGGRAPAGGGRAGGGIPGIAPYYVNPNQLPSAGGYRTAPVQRYPLPYSAPGYSQPVYSNGTLRLTPTVVGVGLLILLLLEHH